jgi:hypothetical protein
VAAAFAHAVGTGVHLGDGPVDLVDRGTGLGAEGEVPLPLDVEGVALARLLVELYVARLHVLGQLLGIDP